MQNRTHIAIKRQTHTELKKYCSEEGLIMRAFVEKIIQAEIRKQKRAISPSEK